MAEFHVATSVSGSWYCARAVALSHWLTGTLEYDRAIFNVIGDTCAFPIIELKCLLSKSLLT